MEITVTVIKPLNVTATNIAFGRIVAGTTEEAKQGTFTIDGENELPVTINAIATTTDKTVPGLYTGNLTLLVRYE
ncbi:hypothetical protein [uncultured Cetobacterium sp.]|uniref:hypothetical protein n=1 Tax=uncultured Cetobacterium sp. TaxID=527638 RepID=UPI002602E634|nr:hypothetical protein [uncultured Cetobacterium sp.]